MVSSGLLQMKGDDQMKELTRELTITIEMNEDETRVEVMDNETGMTNTSEFYGSSDEHTEFDAWLGTEVVSWISIMADEFEEIDEE